MKRSLILVLLAGVFVGCPQSNLTPSITVNSSPGILTISGTGFDSTVSSCARLALEGLPQPSSNVAIEVAQCSGGSFQNFNWQYSYVGVGCDPSNPSNARSATVFATDTQGTNAGASQTVSIPWGPTCALAGTCGAIGQSACPGGTCSAGGVNVGGVCQACGSEGQPACTGNTCQGDLHPNFQGEQIVCTANCGHTQSGTNPVPQSPCEVPLVPPNLSQGGIFTCYDHAMIDTFGNCTCVPNTLNTCPVSTSIPKPPAPNMGLCIQGQFKDINGNGC